MPLRLNVDREAVRTLVVAVGVREAARQMGIPEATVQAWSARGKWSNAVQIARQAISDRKNAATNLQPDIPKPADVLANSLEEDSKITKVGLSRAAKSAAEHFGKSKAPYIIKRAKQLRDITATAASLHGWEDKGSHGVTLNLGIAFNNMQ